MYNYNTLTETPEAAMEALARLERIAPERHTTLVSHRRCAEWRRESEA